MQLNGNENHIIIAKFLQKITNIFYTMIMFQLEHKRFATNKNITIDIDIMKY